MSSHVVASSMCWSRHYGQLFRPCRVANTLYIFLNAYTLEVIYALIFVIPAQLIIIILKRAEGIDAYDYGVSYNPFNFLN